jgi:hypothetical protein
MKFRFFLQVDAFKMDQERERMLEEKVFQILSFLLKVTFVNLRFN